MKYFYVLLLSLVSFFVFGQVDNPLPEELIESIKARIEAGLNQSIAIGVIDKNGPRYYTYGTKTLNGKDVDEHTIYEIGSISKAFTGILLANSSFQEKVNIDDPANKYLPGNAMVNSRNEKQITLGHLSDHTSSLPRLPSNMSPANPANPYADYSVEQLYAFISGYKLNRDIGSEYEYSNLAQGLLGHILGLVNGMSYEELMVQTIAQPLHMEETKITLDKNMKKNLAFGHANGMEVENWDLPTLAAAGAIRSSTYDMLTFLSANMGMEDHPLLPAMQLSHKIRHHKAGAMRVGLGWHIANGQDGDVIWHNGGTGGYRAFAGFVKETKKGVVVLTNSTEGVDDIGFYLLDPGSILRTIRPHIAAEVRKAIDEKSIEEAVNKYNNLKATQPEAYDFGETEMNALGYYYMEKNLPAALAIFNLNEEAYPTSSNVYDSHGEALMKDGQTELAIKKYRKSVELNPGNNNGIAKLKQMGVEIKINALEIPEKVLQLYVGKYELSPSFHIQVTTENGKLFAQATGQPKFELFASSETTFYLKVVEARIAFSKNDSDQVTHMTLYQGGQEVPGKKVE